MLQAGVGTSLWRKAPTIRVDRWELLASTCRPPRKNNFSRRCQARPRNTHGPAPELVQISLHQNVDHGDGGAWTTCPCRWWWWCWCSLSPGWCTPSRRPRPHSQSVLSLREGGKKTSEMTNTKAISIAKAQNSTESEYFSKFWKKKMQKTKIYHVRHLVYWQQVGFQSVYKPNKCCHLVHFSPTLIFLQRGSNRK